MPKPPTDRSIIAPKGLVTLMVGETRFATESHALGLRTGSAVACTGDDQRPFELGNTSEERQHQPAMRRGGVSPGIAKRFKPGALFADGMIRARVT